MKKIWEKIKKIFEKFKSYSAWVSLSAAIVLLVTALGKVFGFSVENEVVENVVMSVAGVLVVLGLVSAPLTADDSEEAGDDAQEDESLAEKSNDSNSEVEKNEKNEKNDDKNVDE